MKKDYRFKSAFLQKAQNLMLKHHSASAWEALDSEERNEDDLNGTGNNKQIS